MKNKIASLAQNALLHSDFKAFSDALATQSFPESFGVLANPEVFTLVAKQIGHDDLTNWIVRPLTWDVRLYDSHITLSPAETFLHLLWQDLSIKIALKLDEVADRAHIASKGAVLCFFGCARFSIVVEYVRSRMGAVRLRPLASLMEPNGVLELTSLLDGASPEALNSIKNATLSVDKLVYQRGCIVHVDRQREDVFGPTIDTIILGELVAERLQTITLDRKISALEIGPGSGLLSTILASSDHIDDLTAVDLNGAAVICTLKNLQINDATLDAKHQRLRIRAEKFEPNQLAAPFDFVVCNPPYIPEDTDSPSTLMKAYGRAVGGLDLCIEILNNLPKLLAPSGVLLLMTSSVSDREVVASIPEGFSTVPALGDGGRRVPLDVDIVWQEAGWREQLLTDHRIEQDANGVLWHHLRPLWITAPPAKIRTARPPQPVAPASASLNQAGGEKLATITNIRYALLLRFRDLVTEPGGNIDEHRRIIRQRGYAWWGWWGRQREKIPRSVFEVLFSSEAIPTEIFLFDSGMMRLYRTSASKVVVAPSHLGVNSPDFEATPAYYVRGRYPAWFRLEDEIVAIDDLSAIVVAHPTLDPTFSTLDPGDMGQSLDFDALSNDGATLWVVISKEA